jgi:hypothetical protein
VQNSISRDTVKGTRVSFFGCARLAGVSWLFALPRFVKTELPVNADLAFAQ